MKCHCSMSCRKYFVTKIIAMTPQLCWLLLNMLCRGCFLQTENVFFLQLRIAMATQTKCHVWEHLYAIFHYLAYFFIGHMETSRGHIIFPWETDALVPV